MVWSMWGYFQTIGILKRLLLRCIHHFQSDFINNMDHMRISGTEPSSVILSQTIWKVVSKVWKYVQKVPKQVDAKWDGVNKTIKLLFQSILTRTILMLSKRYESTEVNRRTWLHVPSGTHWSTSSDRGNSPHRDNGWYFGTRLNTVPLIGQMYYQLVNFDLTWSFHRRWELGFYWKWRWVWLTYKGRWLTFRTQAPLPIGICRCSLSWNYDCYNITIFCTLNIRGTSYFRLFCLNSILWYTLPILFNERDHSWGVAVADQDIVSLLRLDTPQVICVEALEINNN